MNGNETQFGEQAKTNIFEKNKSSSHTGNNLNNSSISGVNVCPNCKTSYKMAKLVVESRPQTFSTVNKETLTEDYTLKTQDMLSKMSEKVEKALQSKKKWKGRFTVLKNKIF